MNGNLLYASFQTFLRITTTLLLDLKVKGVHHVPRTGGVLIVSNHQSYLDPAIIGCHLPRPTGFLAKSELFENKFFGSFISKLYAFPVRQGEGDIGAVREAIRRLQEGNALLLFPEGSRTEDGEFLSLEAGIGLIIRKAHVPVVPCVVEGSFASWPKGKKWFSARPVRVTFGPPLQLGHLKASKIVHEVETTLHRMFADVRAEIRRESHER